MWSNVTKSVDISYEPNNPFFLFQNVSNMSVDSASLLFLELEKKCGYGGKSVRQAATHPGNWRRGQFGHDEEGVDPVNSTG